MNRIRDKDIPRLAMLTKVNQDDFAKLVSMGLIDHAPAMRLLVKYSFQKLKNKKYYKIKQIVKAVADEYGVTEHFVHDSVYTRKKRLHYCTQCMRLISARDNIRNNGLCDDCVSKKIIVD
jgi:hypothetical protein